MALADGSVELPPACLMNFSSLTEPSYRAISVLGLIQAGVVVGGTLFVSAMLKAHGYKGGVPDDFFRSDVLFVRHFGFLLLLFPLVWALLSILATRSNAPVWLSPALIIFGIVAVLVGIYGYAIMGLQPGVL